MAEPPPFCAVLRPNRSLGPRGFAVLMAAVGGISFVAGMVFVAMGAWPVFGFLGLDALLIYFAFRLNYRDGRLRETVEIIDGEMRITRTHPSGREEEWTFEPSWARVDLRGDVETGNALSVVSHGRHLELARFLSHSERAEFADVLSDALARYKPA